MLPFHWATKMEVETNNLLLILEGNCLFLALVFTGNLSPLPSRVDGLQDGDQRCKVFPTVREDQLRDHLRNLNIQKSM